LIKPTVIQKAVDVLKQGGIVAYPTEAVYGLGCDPFNAAAVHNLVALKKRDIRKGLILIAATWEQLQPLVKEIPAANLQKVLATWPGSVTWVFPATAKVPTWITGEHSSVAIRVSNHPVVQELCLAYGGPIVSTSANIAARPAARSRISVMRQFGRKIDFIVAGSVGALSSPTPIYDALTGALLRS
jgi:L-threonylcarbamoyladenylate synthase